MDWLDLLAVQGTLKSLLQHHSSKASIFQHSAFFTVQLSHPYMTTGKTIALTRQTFVGKVTSLLFNMLSRLVITFFPRSKHLLISWLQSPSAWKTVIFQFLQLTISGPYIGAYLPSREMHLISIDSLKFSSIFFLPWKVKVKSLSRVQLFPTPWTVAYQAPLSMGFSR